MHTVLADFGGSVPVETRSFARWFSFSLHQYNIPGSFLAVALDRGFDVIGRDINQKCVDGTISNLRHLQSQGRWQIDTCDSGAGSSPINGQVDCVVVS